MAKLYEVSAEIRVLLLADSPEEAEDLATSTYFEDEIREQAGIGEIFENVTVSEITDQKQVPEPWDNAIPWGGDGWKTCRQIAEQEK